MTRALLLPVYGPPTFVEYEGLEGLQELVCGNIELAPVQFDGRVSVFVNDEGKLADDEGNRLFEPNRAVWEDGKLVDVLFGPVVCVGCDPTTGEDLNITDEQAAAVEERFGQTSIAHAAMVMEALRSFEMAVVSLGSYDPTAEEEPVC